MVYEAKKVGTLKDGRDVYKVVAPLDKQLEALAKVEINSLVAPDEIAQIRLEGISNDYSGTSIASVAIKGGKLILVRNSPLTNLSITLDAVKAHASCRHFETSKDYYDRIESLAKSQDFLALEDRDALIVSQTGDFSLVAEMPETQFILRKQTQPYFSKFTKRTIPFYGISAPSKDKAVINYLWFSGSQVGSSLGCWSGDLDSDDGAFGLFDFLEVGAQRKGYTLTEIKNANSQIIPAVFNETKLSELDLTKPVKKPEVRISEPYIPYEIKPREVHPITKDEKIIPLSIMEINDEK